MLDATRLFGRRCLRLMARPADATREIVHARVLAAGFLMGWFVSAGNCLWVGEVLWPGWGRVWVYLGVAALAGALLFLLQASLLHILGRLAGGRGEWAVTASMFGYATTPFLAWLITVWVTLGCWVRAVGPVPLYVAALLALVLSLLVVLVTALAIFRHGMAEGHGLRPGRAWVVTLGGAVALVVAGNLLSGSFVAQRSITAANHEAMEMAPVPFRAVSPEQALRLRVEYKLNRRAILAGQIRRGEVVVVDAEAGGAWAGRVLGLPGETVELKHGRLLVNGRPSEEPWAKRGAISVPSRALGADEYLLALDRSVPGLSPDWNSEFRRVVSRKRIVGVPFAVHAWLLRLWLGSGQGADEERQSS